MNLFSLYPYSLKSAQPLNARSTQQEHPGVLLKVNFPVGLGYANLHPWPSLGDPSLEELLPDLTAHPLGQQALACAELDASARAAGRSLFQDLTVPPSHRTLPAFSSEIIAESLRLGFDTVKVKLGKNWNQEQALLHDLLPKFPQLRWRFDFNHLGKEEELLSFFKSIPPEQRAQIDFIEDPFPFHENNWKLFTSTTQIPLANDFNGDPNAPFHVIKPALQKIPRHSQENQRTIATSYMDHPLGQSYAAYCAAQASITETCGLQTHHLFTPTPFTQELGPESPTFHPAPGTGLGFDNLLRNLRWQKLS